MVSALITLLLTQAPSANFGATAEGEENESAPVLKGFDLGLTIYNSSGTYFGAEGYSNSFSFWFEPAWRFGHTFFRGTWAEHFALAARIPLEVEVMGNDPRFRGTGFGTSTIYNPEGLGSITTQSGAVEGTGHRGALLGDAFLSLLHGRLFSVLGIEASTAIRLTLPTSISSQNSGLITAVGAGLIFERRFFDRLALGYMFRPTKYFFSRTQGSIRPLGTTVTINGNPEQTWTPSSDGVPNMDYGFMNGVWVTLDLPKGFNLGLDYFIFNTKPYDVTGGCQPIAVAGVDVCRDRQGRPGVWRNEQWFLASAGFSHSFWSVSLGLSTFRTLEGEDGRITQPFFESNRNNHTTVYLSFSATAEGIAGWATSKPHEEKKQ